MCEQNASNLDRDDSNVDVAPIPLIKGARQMDEQSPSSQREAGVADSMRESADRADIRWTGHMLVDMGIATLAAFSSRERPEDITLADLERFATYTERALRTRALRSHASVLFTTNIPYLQPSFPQDRRDANAREILRAFALVPGDPGIVCVYCGRSAIRLTTESGRAYREWVPLLTGQGVVNFAPYGQHGLAICGHCVTALQALIIGAPSCEGRALVVSADDASQLIALIRDWLPDIQKRIHLSEVSGDKIKTWKAPRTRLIERLIEFDRRDGLMKAPTGFTLYHVTNDGRGPTIDIHYLRQPIVQFVRLAQAGAYHAAWYYISSRKWMDDEKRAVDREPQSDERPYWRNALYEDLFRLPDNAAGLLHRYFFSLQLASIQSVPMGRHVSLWRLTQLFVQEVMGMEDGRIQVIRALGDTLADEIVTENDRGLFRTTVQATRYFTVRRALLGVSSRRLQRGEPPVVSFEDFLTIFEVGEELPRTDWRLAWDLVLIRLIDRLHGREWFRQHADVAEDLAEIEEQALAEVEATSEILPTGTVVTGTVV